MNYKLFLNSLKNSNNSSIVTAFMEAYDALFETPHADTIDGRVVDMHVEDVLKELGKEKTLEYINYLIQGIESNNKIEFMFINKGQEDHIDHPLNEFLPDRISDLLNRLNLIKNSLK